MPRNQPCTLDQVPLLVHEPKTFSDVWQTGYFSTIETSDDREMWSRREFGRQQLWAEVMITIEVGLGGDNTGPRDLAPVTRTYAG